MTGDRTELAEVIDAADLPTMVAAVTSGRQNGRGWTFHCPNPAHADRSPSFTVTREPRTGRWQARCWSQCDWRGDALDFLEWHHGMTRADAVTELRRMTGRYRSDLRAGNRRSTRPAPAPRVNATPAVVAPAPDHQADARPDRATGERVMADYLAHRQWPAEVVERFGLEVVATRSGPAIRHPFYRWDSTTGQWAVHGWQDRAADPAATPRWMTPKGCTLPAYNLPATTDPEAVVLVVCEGPADTITATVALDRSGLGGMAVAIGVAGASQWPAEADELVRNRGRWALVMIAADADAAGQSLAKRAGTAAWRGRHPVVVYQSNLEGEDMTDMLRRGGLDHLATELGTAVVHQLERIERGGAA